MVARKSFVEPLIVAEGQSEAYWQLHAMAALRDPLSFEGGAPAMLSTSRRLWRGEEAIDGGERHRGRGL